jgi:hypothetical protein
MTAAQIATEAFEERAHMIEMRNITTAPERSSTHKPVALSVLCFTAELAIRQQVPFRMRSGAFVRGDAQPSNKDAHERRSTKPLSLPARAGKGEDGFLGYLMCAFSVTQ